MIGDVLALVGQVTNPLVEDIAVVDVLKHAREDVKEHVQIRVMLEVVEDGNI